jgi:hypothetical protein
VKLRIFERQCLANVKLWGCRRCLSYACPIEDNDTDKYSVPPPYETPNFVLVTARFPGLFCSIHLVVSLIVFYRPCSKFL